jgi:ribose/xylose/arabinose/galactoside ABC-type transport system permease subunit
MAAEQTRPHAPRRPAGGRFLVRDLFGAPGSVRRPLVFLAIAFALSEIVAPSFLRLSNLRALLISSSFLIVTAVGEAFVVLMGMIDLGVQSVLASAGMMVAYLNLMVALPAAIAVPVALLYGVVVGWLVGVLVTRGRIASFIVTLGTYWGLTGIALLFNRGDNINPYSVTPPRQFGFLGFAGHLGPVPMLILVGALVVVVAEVIVSATPLGLWVKSVGSNEAAARVVGLDADALKTIAFMVSGGLAALAGVMITAWQDSIYPLTAQGYSLQAIAGVILGGIPFTGGRGTILGAAIGALIIGLINDLIVLLGLPALYEYIFVAVVLVVAGLQTRGKGFVK